MVAYTSPDCLPYYECTDSPCLNTGTVCEPSNVFCDMTALLEVILNDFDDTVARTATGVPFAKVARSAEQVMSLDDVQPFMQVAWDTVVVDNDNMVSLDTDNIYVKINRPGIWWIELYVAGIPNNNIAGSNFSELASYITQRGPTVGGIPGTVLSETTAKWRQNLISVQPGSTYNRLAFAMQISAADLAVNSTIDIAAVVGATGTITDDSTLTVSYAEMTVYWTAESTV